MAEAEAEFVVEEDVGAYTPLKGRSRAFALRIVRLVQSLPQDEVTRVLGRQLLRAGTSVGANYRAACRGRSPAEFISKLGIVEEEADETIYWLELLADTGSVKAHLLSDLVREANELLAIIVASIRTARLKKQPLPFFHSLPFRIPHSAFLPSFRISPMTFEQLEAVYHQPFFDLIQQARRVHEAHWPAQKDEMQLCTLLSIKTGGCSEDCGYCAQSAHYSTGVKSERLMEADDVLAAARRAKANGSTRFCMGAAWRGVRAGEKKFDQVLGLVREVSQLGMEVCVTLGQLSDREAALLKEAGVTAYNHNIDTSPEHYPNIVSTHTFQDRLDTIRAVQGSGMALCCGGIVGLGETPNDRLRMLEVLANLDPAPESVPINCLMAMPGTPLEDAPPVDIFDLVRLIATARIALPRARVRLSAGRTRLSPEGQALCFFAGANSVFYGDKLLTAANPAARADLALLRALDLRPSTLPADAVANLAGVAENR